jgi:hypothetical protein
MRPQYKAIPGQKKTPQKRGFFISKAKLYFLAASRSLTSLITSSDTFFGQGM